MQALRTWQAEAIAEEWTGQEVRELDEGFASPLVDLAALPNCTIRELRWVL